MPQLISPAAMAELCRTGQKVELLDVRTPIEFQEVHIPFAKNIPLDQLDPEQIKTQLKDSSQVIYVTCRSGGRGQKACDKLTAAGIANVVNLEGGTLAWEAAGLNVVRGKKMMSLERQVRIAAGSLVVLSVILAWSVDPYFIGLAAFVGAGLVFAGVTDTCGMGMLLAKMPWNRASDVGTTCATKKPANSIPNT
jgi:rhodanese-related sulfurtransferase